MRKRMYGKLTALALAGAMVLSGCGQSGGNSGTSTADSKAETSASSGAETSSEKKPESIGRTDIISANSSDIRSMDPQVGVDSPSATLNFHIYNGLIKIDDNREPGSGRVRVLQIHSGIPRRVRLMAAAGTA